MTEKHFSIQGNVEHFTIADIAKENRDFRKVLWTGEHSQASSLIAVIALFTAGSLRTVTETSAPAHPGIPERSALLVIPMDFNDRVIHIHHHPLARAPRCVSGSSQKRLGMRLGMSGIDYVSPGPVGTLAHPVSVGIKPVSRSDQAFS